MGGCNFQKRHPSSEALESWLFPTWSDPAVDQHIMGKLQTGSSADMWVNVRIYGAADRRWLQFVSIVTWGLMTLHRWNGETIKADYWKYSSSPLTAGRTGTSLELLVGAVSVSMPPGKYAAGMESAAHDACRACWSNFACNKWFVSIRTRKSFFLHLTTLSIFPLPQYFCELHYHLLNKCTA